MPSYISIEGAHVLIRTSVCIVKLGVCVAGPLALQIKSLLVLLPLSSLYPACGLAVAVAARDSLKIVSVKCY